MNWFAIIWSGFVATTLALAVFWVGRSFQWTSFSPTVQMGCIVLPDPRRPLTETIGFVIIYLIGSTLAPALLTALLGLWSGPAWIGGLLVGGVLGIAVAAALPIAGMISACIRLGYIQPPGKFGLEWGKPTPAIIILGHMVYGTVAAAIHAGF
jgi:hypothetical protein